jgi:ketosteroid isomerase-like protein
MMATPDKDIQVFVSRCRKAVAEQVSGRTEAFQALWSQADDVVLIGAAGSHQKGWHDVSERLSWASEHLNWGGFQVENLLTNVSEDLAFTVDLENMTREVEGKTEQRILRSSQGYRFEDGQWRVVFRHGDPMAEDLLPPENAGR